MQFRKRSAKPPGSALPELINPDKLGLRGTWQKSITSNSAPKFLHPLGHYILLLLLQLMKADC